MKTMSAIGDDQEPGGKAPSPKKRSRGRKANNGIEPVENDLSQTPTLVSYETGDTIDEEEEDSEADSAAFAPNGAKQNGQGNSDEFGTKKDVPWDSENFDDSDDDWGVQQDFGQDSPGTWDPDSFVKQTGDLDPWKEVEKKDRLQDLPSPALAEPPPDQRKQNSDDEEWPFKSPCAFRGKSGRSRTPRSGRSANSGYGSSSPEKQPLRGVLGGEAAVDAERGDGQKSRESGSSKPKRSSGRPDAEEGDAPPTRPKSRDSDKPLKPTRRSKSIDRNDYQEELDEDDDIDEGSFHKLAENMDKPSSRSKGRKSKESKPVKRRSSKESPGSFGGDDDDEDFEEFGAEETEHRLKGVDDVDPSTIGGERKGWRTRRAENRSSRERSLSSESQESGGRGTVDVAPGSGGKRPPSSRRAMIRRAQSERWRKNVDGEQGPPVGADPDAISRRAKNSLANAELSRSAHSVRRHKSGDFSGISGTHERARGAKTPTSDKRRPRRRKEDQLGTASFHGVHDSGRSDRSVDSMEDYEDYTHKEFQTPGMVDIDDEIYEMMLRANPENTMQLDRRVHRQRGNVSYDQNMPMMTRQALLTRQASQVVMRGRVDASSIDKRRLLIRNNSDASMGSKNDDLSFSQHRARYNPATTGGRRAPPRSRSSGLAAMAAQTMQQAPREDDDNRRKLFRTRSTTTSSFRQYQNKPNMVASRSRPLPGAGDSIDPSTAGAEPERRKQPQRAKSTTALRRPERSDAPRRVETDRKLREPMRRMKKTDSKDDDSINSEESESSSVDTMEGDKSPRKEKKTKSPKSSTPRKPSRMKSPVPLAKPLTRDLSRRSHRRQLHALLYESKMGVNMKDLVKQAQKPDLKKDEPAALTITAP